MRPELDPESILRDVREHDEDHAAMNITSCSTFFKRGACPPLNFDICVRGLLDRLTARNLFICLVERVCYHLDLMAQVN